MPSPSCLNELRADPDLIRLRGHPFRTGRSRRTPSVVSILMRSDRSTTTSSSAVGPWSRHKSRDHGRIKAVDATICPDAAGGAGTGIAPVGHEDPSTVRASAGCRERCRLLIRGCHSQHEVVGEPWSDELQPSRKALRIEPMQTHRRTAGHV